MSSAMLGWVLAIFGVIVLVFAVLLWTRLLKTLVLLTVLGTGVSLADSVDWNAPMTPLAFIKIGLLSSCVWFIIHFIWLEWRTWNGLDQWPTPKGRYYDRWLQLPRDRGGDYYPWLAEQMGWQEPWASWVQMEKETKSLKRGPHN